jgi:hypothetical protein
MSAAVLNSGTVGLGETDVPGESDVTVTVLDPELATNISFLPGSYASPTGVPTCTVATTLLVLSDMTETESEPQLDTNISPLPES